MLVVENRPKAFKHQIIVQLENLVQSGHPAKKGHSSKSKIPVVTSHVVRYTFQALEKMGKSEEAFTSREAAQSAFANVGHFVDPVTG
jgi:hypothetical protein